MRERERFQDWTNEQPEWQNYANPESIKSLIDDFLAEEGAELRLAPGMSLALQFSRLWGRQYDQQVERVEAETSIEIKIIKLNKMAFHLPAHFLVKYLSSMS